MTPGAPATDCGAPRGAATTVAAPGTGRKIHAVAWAALGGAAPGTGRKARAVAWAALGGAAPGTGRKARAVAWAAALAAMVVALSGAPFFVPAVAARMGEEPNGAAAGPDRAAEQRGRAGEEPGSATGPWDLAPGQRDEAARQPVRAADQPDRAAADPAVTVRYVDDDPGCDGQRPCYQSIQAAVDVATSGEVVSVAAGWYTETVVVVDRALAFQGPGAGQPAAADDPSRHALWMGTRDGTPGAALTVDAFAANVTGTLVQGFRFVGGGAGVRLIGRRLFDTAAVPPDLPASVHDAVLTGTLVVDNRFAAVGDSAADRGALVTSWADGVVFRGNAVVGGGGATVRAGSRIVLAGNAFTGTAGTAVRVLADGEDVTVADNRVHATEGAGIALQPSTSGSRVGIGRRMRLHGNVVTDSGAEGIRVDVASGGELHDVVLDGDRVTGAGAGADVAGADVAGGIVLAGRGDDLSDVTIGATVVEGSVARGAGTGAGIHATAVAGSLAITGAHLTGNDGAGLHAIDIGRLSVTGSRIAGNNVGVRLVETPAGPGPGADLVLGGSPATGNRLAGNAEGALVLVNDTHSTVSTPDVVATYNDWGTAWAPAIEDAIRHRPDDIFLGRVTYLPALGAAATVALAAEPPTLTADVTAESTVTLRAGDAAGAPVMDDTVVTFKSDAGTLTGAGAAAEVEAAPAAGGPERHGEWEDLDGQAFGPFSGTGYARGTGVGATLAWRFDAPALVVRYGQTTLLTGTFTARVNDRELGPYRTDGPDKSWVERLIVRDLGAGPHHVTVTVTSGEVNFDSLTAGATTYGGAAVASLRASTRVGVARIVGTAHGAGGPVTGTVDVAFTAGLPSQLALTLGTEGLPVGGATTPVTVTVRDALGRPVADGTPVNLAATLATVTPARAGTVAGMVQAEVATGQQAGVATVRAESGGTVVTRDLRVLPGPPHTVQVSARPNTLPANSRATAALTIDARDRFGNAVRDNTTVTLGTTLGAVVPVKAATSAGIARAELRAGDRAGTAVVNAGAGAATGSAPVTFTATDLRITKSAEPTTSVVPGEPVTFTLRFANAGVGSVYDVLIDDILPAGLISPVVRTAATRPLERVADRPLAFRTAQLAPGDGGWITVSLKVDTSLAWGTRRIITNRVAIVAAGAAERTPADNAAEADITVVPGAVYSVTLVAPDQLAVGGATGALRAVLADRFGNPARDGTAVAFATDLGSVSPELTTTRDGAATATLTTGSRAGTTTVRVSTLDDRGATARVIIAPGPPHTLELVSARAWLVAGGDTTAITATVRDQYANGIGGQAVTFATTEGLLARPNGTTGPSGAVTTTLRSAVRAAPARVTAHSGALSAELDVSVVAAAPAALILRLTPTHAPAGTPVQAVASVRDAFGNPVPGAVVRFDATIGRMVPVAASTDAAGEAASTVTGTLPGQGTVRAVLAALADERRLIVEGGSIYLPIAINPLRGP